MAKYRNAPAAARTATAVPDRRRPGDDAVFHDGIDLPHFAAFDLLKDASGRERLRDYYRRYAAIARDSRLGFVLESADLARERATGRRSSAIRREALAAVNRRRSQLMAELRDELETRAIADGDQRQHRPARRRLQPGHA